MLWLPFNVRVQLHVWRTAVMHAALLHLCALPLSSWKWWRLLLFVPMINLLLVKVYMPVGFWRWCQAAAAQLESCGGRAPSITTGGAAAAADNSHHQVICVCVNMHNTSQHHIRSVSV